MKNNELLYDELKKSPLAVKDSTIEEVIIWLDLHSLTDAKGIKTVLSVTRDNFHIGPNDMNLISYPTSIHVKTYMQGIQYDAFWISDVIFVNIFKVMFIGNLLNNNVKFIRSLLKFACSEINKLKIKCKRINPPFRSYEELFEVFAEFRDKLEEKLIQKV